MSVVLIQRSSVSVEGSDEPAPDLYYLSGTGWQSVEASATTYATKEAALVDGETQREALGPGARILTKDLTSGAEWVVPPLTQ